MLSIWDITAVRLRHVGFHLRCLLHTSDSFHSMKIINGSLLRIAQHLNLANNSTKQVESSESLRNGLRRLPS